MAQHDFNIDNQSAPAFRGDLNNALEALGTLSSGATPPATTYANMLWYDTANNILYMRSEADDAWIALGTLDQGTNTFNVANLTNLTQVQVENPASTVFGQVSGERLGQAVIANAMTVDEFVYDFDVDGGVSVVQFTEDLSVYRFLDLESNISLASTVDPAIQFSPDGGTTYRTTGYTASTSDTVNGGGETVGLVLTRQVSDGAIGSCRLFNIGSASQKSSGGGQFCDPGGAYVTTMGGRYNTEEAHNALRVNCFGVLITQGTITVRGYKFT